MYSFWSPTQNKINQTVDDSKKIYNTITLCYIATEEDVNKVGKMLLLCSTKQHFKNSFLQYFKSIGYHVIKSIYYLLQI